MSEKTLTIGKSERRKDASDKVTGEAEYVADIPLDGVAHGAVVRSPHHYARILNIDMQAAEAASGVLRFLTANDIPGAKTFGALIPDQPSLAIDVVRHLGEPVALVIAESREAALQASELVEVEYEPLEPVFDPVDALKPDAPRLHPEGNLVAQFDFTEGDPEAEFSQADIVIEDTFSVPRIHPGYMEPENSLARWNDDGSITVWVSSQQPFYDQQMIADALALPIEKVQVKSAVIGGAFGGKEDASLAILTALGAWAIRGNFKLVNTRHESFLAHPKRHPAQIKMKIGAKQDGTILALKAIAHMDTGAYASYGPAVGVILTETLTGSYRIPNVHLETLVSYTNSPFSGAMRGFGSPQSHFALESLLDILAVELGIDSVELRKRNILRPGDSFFTKVVVNETANSLPECLQIADDTLNKWREIPAQPGKVAGVGMALAAQSMGLGAKVPDDSTHRLEWLPDGSVALHLGAPDMGQGLSLVAEQITAEALGLPFDLVKTVPLDTLRSPNGNVSCASRMTYMTGNAVIDAASQLIAQLLDEAAKRLNQPRLQFSYSAGNVITPKGERIKAAEIISRVADDGIQLQSEATFSFPYPQETTPQHLPIGMPHVIFVFGAQMVRVEIDPELGIVEVTHLTAVHDLGRVISRAGVEGQIEGGVATGLGYALYENMTLKDDGKWVDSFTEYLLPTSMDMPDNLETILLEIPEASGPYGAKGIGEIPLVPTAPAVANAVYDALGVRVKSLPITPEKLVGLKMI
jgi:CO/xanthine dehydrogenase Mo-binding subunit